MCNRRCRHAFGQRSGGAEFFYKEEVGMKDGRRRVVIENLSPQVEGGQFPAKRAVGELLTVTADIFVDGHDALLAVLQHRLDESKEYLENYMVHEVNDRWSATIKIEEARDIYFTIAAWVDHFSSWLDKVKKKFAAEQDIAVELLDGAEMIQATAERAAAAGQSEDAERLQGFVEQLTTLPAGKALVVVDDSLLAALMNKHVDRNLASVYPEELHVQIEPRLASCSAWYELFPRSIGPNGQHGTFRDVIAELPRIREMGFDILYLPPIHPIGETYRKGPNNSPQAEPGDVGSPWAIGSAAGGHTAVHPDLGTMQDFADLVAAAEAKDIAIALDIAFQCSPDHPWVGEHPGWFQTRADGSIQYAENPPKKYQDVYPF